MFESIMTYATTFLLHAALGCGIVFVASWLAFRGARALGWNVRGARGPEWVAATLRVGTLLALLIMAPLTGLQTGTIAAMDQALRTSSEDFAIAAALKVGAPLGIVSADQKLSLADAERLIARWAPQWTTRGHAAINDSPWVKRAGDYWQSLPDVLRSWIVKQGPGSETTPRELVRYAWRHGAAPAIAATKWHALAFAYGLAALLIGVFALIEWSWLAFTRSSQKPADPISSTLP